MQCSLKNYPPQINTLTSQRIANKGVEHFKFPMYRVLLPTLQVTHNRGLSKKTPPISDLKKKKKRANIQEDLFAIGWGAWRGNVGQQSPSTQRFHKLFPRSSTKPQTWGFPGTNCCLDRLWEKYGLGAGGGGYHKHARTRILGVRDHRRQRKASHRRECVRASVCPR